MDWSEIGDDIGYCNYTLGVSVDILEPVIAIRTNKNERTAQEVFIMQIIKRMTVGFLLIGTLLSCAACGNASDPAGVSSALSASGNTSASEHETDPLKELLLNSSRDEIPKLSEEKATLTYYVPMHASSTVVLKNYGESEAYKKLEELTNVHIEFQHPAVGQEKEQYQLMIASKNLPDIVEEGWEASYPGGPDKALADGIYLRLNDLIDDYAPNYKYYRDGDAEIARQTMTDAGNIMSFACLQTMDEPPWWGPVIRKDYLDQVGEAVPETIDDWYRVLTKFKTELGVKAPLMLSGSGIDTFGVFNGAYNAPSEWFQVDGAVAYGYIQPGFKEYLSTMNKWYTEGLVDKDFITRDATQMNAMMTNGEAGAWSGSYTTHLDAPLKTVNGADGYALTAAPMPSLNGEDIGYRNFNFHNKSRPAYITSSSKNAALAAAWLDTHYSETGYYLFNYGIEGVSYNMEDGTPVFTELITNNPDGLAYEYINWKYKLHEGPYLRNYAALPPYSPEVEESMKIWGKTSTAKTMPLISLTPEESEKLSKIITDIDAYKNTMILKFIVGEESLDKFEDYVAQIEKMGIADALAIEQAAYDRYQSR